MKPNFWNKVVFALGVSSIGIAIPALADESVSSTNQAPPALTSQQFVSDAAVGGMKEIFLSEAARDKSTNADVKSFADRMVKDHRAANKKLMRIAKDEGLNFPSTNMFSANDPNWSYPLIANPDNLKGAELLTLTNLPYLSDYQDVKRLQSLTGDQFDQAYARVMVSDHIQAVSEFETAAQSLSNPALKKFAQNTLPTLHEHSKMAQKLNDKLNAPGGMSATDQQAISQPGSTLMPLTSP